MKTVIKTYNNIDVPIENEIYWRKLTAIVESVYYSTDIDCHRNDWIDVQLLFEMLNFENLLSHWLVYFFMWNCPQACGKESQQTKTQYHTKSVLSKLYDTIYQQGHMS